MNEITQKLIVTLIIVPVILGIFRGAKEAGIAVTAIFVALCFANLDKIESFKAGVVQLRTAVKDAYAAIEQLRELGVSLSSPIIDELAISGRHFQLIHLKYKLERVAKIEDTLKKLGVPKEEIEEACSTMYTRITREHTRSVLVSLQTSHPGKESLFEGLPDGKMDDWEKEKIQKFINENGLKMSEETREYFLDLDYFLKNKKLRREEKWQS
jgi:hypothetical protein